MTVNVKNTRIEAGPGTFVAHDVALAAAACVVDVLRGVSGPYGDLVQQARRAVGSAPLNLAEGAGRAGKDRVQHYRIAYGSAREAMSALRLLVAVRALDAAAGRGRSRCSTGSAR